jgi:hypothetical protein
MLVKWNTRVFGGRGARGRRCCSVGSEAEADNQRSYILNQGQTLKHKESAFFFCSARFSVFFCSARFSVYSVEVPSSICISAAHLEEKQSYIHF